ncbi:MAG: 23S rRNA (adenine(2503)-C(2))-methyltransferase RlmN [Chloroflexota bacterium]
MQTEENILNLYDASLAELEDVVQSWGQPSYRARQIYRQLYVNLTDEPQMMTDLSLPLRDRLTSETQIGNLKTVRVQKADAGLTRKALFRLPGGAVVESVLMVYPDRATVCVSTQAGCAMGCDFCATGKLGLLRNLSPGEIIEQVLWAAREVKHLVPETPDSHPNLPQKLSNVVFMGMGEPFANYDRWWQAVERLHDPRGFNLGARNLTVSTVGLVPGILRLAEEKLPINLAISLHTADDTLRSEMMPVNRRYPIAALMEATQAYIAKTNRRVSFEYVLLEGRNDSPEQATDLANLVEGMLCHINLIPWNPVPGMPLSRSNRQRISTFQRILQDRGVACTVRVERGVEIAAACGQLAGVPIEVG